jgi:hypothetical protein
MDSIPSRPRRPLVIVSDDIGIRAAWAVALPRTYPVTVSTQASAHRSLSGSGARTWSWSMSMPIL